MPDTHLIPLLLALGCTNNATGPFSEDSSSGVGDGGDSTAACTMNTTWSASSVNIHLDGCVGTYWWGMVGEVNGELWTGEDCCDGAALDDGTHVQWCHTLIEGEASLVCVEDPADVTSVSETALCPSDDNPPVSYIIKSDAGECWTWGADTSYFETCGDCIEI